MSEGDRFDLEPQDADELRPVAAWLDLKRPVPSAAFRGSLRRELAGRHRANPAAPRHLWVLVTSAFGGGMALLVIAALGVGGAGPFAA